MDINLSLISMKDIINYGGLSIDVTCELIKEALLDYKNGFILLPDKISQIFDEKNQDRINCMPSTLVNKNICGVKWVSVFPQNPVRFGIQNVSGVIILSELKYGFPIAILDGTYITALRTACMGGLAAKYLARKNSQTYGTIGTGEQAKMHFRVIKHFFPSIKKCYVSSRNYEHELEFKRDFEQEYSDVEFILCNGDYRKATNDSDIVVSAVSCQEPLFKADSIKKGSFYCHVGGWEDEYGVPLKANKIICDNWDALKHRGSPTIARMYKDGILKDSDIYCDLCDIIDSSRKGRESDDEFIYFNSIGLSYIDVSVAIEAYNNVTAKQKEKKWSMIE